MKNEMNHGELSSDVSSARDQSELARTRKQMHILWGALVLIMLAGVAAGMIGFRPDELRAQAEQKAQEAQQSATLASQKQQEAQQNAELAAQREQTAQKNAELAVQREQAAQRSAELAVQREQVAQNNANLAAQKEKAALQKVALTRVNLLAAQAQAALNDPSGLSMLLVNEAVQLGRREDIPYTPVGEEALWDVITRTNPTLPINNGKGVDSLMVSPDGRWLASQSDYFVLLLDLQADNPAASALKLSTDSDIYVRSMSFSPDGRWLAVGDIGGTIQLWDLHAEKPGSSWLVLKGHKDSVSSVAFSRDGHRLFSGGMDKKVRVWDLQAKDPGVAPLILRGHEDRIGVLATSPDGRWLASGSDDTTIRVWDLQAKDPGVAPLVLRGHEGAIQSLEFNRDGHWLVSGARPTTTNWENNPVLLWDLHNSTPGANPRVLCKCANGDWVCPLLLSPDGRWLVFWMQFYPLHTIQLWDLSAEDPVTASFKLPNDVGYWWDPMDISLDGRWLVTTSFNIEIGTGISDSPTKIWLWDLQAKEPTAHPLVLDGPNNTTELAVSANGRWIAAMGLDWTTTSKAVWIWDLESKEKTTPRILRWPKTPPKTEVDAIRPIHRVFAISPDERWLVLGSEDSTIFVWDLNLDNLLQQTCQIARRNLTRDEWARYFPDEAYRLTCPQFAVGK